MHEALVTWLGSLEALADVPVAQLDWLAGRATSLKVAEGTTIFTRGEPMLFLYIVVSGRVNIYSPQGHQQITLVLEPGQISGLLPFSRMKTATGSGIAAAPAELLLLHAADLREVILHHYELCEALVHLMISRVRNFTSLQQQNEKMMALGKLSAGLAHELNNPASAIVRDAAALQQQAALQPSAFRDIIDTGITVAQTDAIRELLLNSLTHARPALTLLQRMDTEEEFISWMDARHINDSTALAAAFTDAGFCIQDLDRLAAHIPESQPGPVFKWLAAMIVTDKMAGDIREAAQRIETLVASIKSFTHMDRGQEAQWTDIHSGIRNTITMLGHKIRAGNVQLTEDFDLSLPEVKVMIGELNQVWTNLIDNALDAMEGADNRRLHITTGRDHDYIQVTITDNGPGIPPDLRNMIFDPFFTTKEMGKGTGLGLDIVQRIVQQHHGTVQLSSVPGTTSFTVCIPLNC